MCGVFVTGITYPVKHANATPLENMKTGARVMTRQKVLRSRNLVAAVTCCNNHVTRCSTSRESCALFLVSGMHAHNSHTPNILSVLGTSASAASAPSIAATAPDMASHRTRQALSCCDTDVQPADSACSAARRASGPAAS